jgi:hypothetical protein
VSFETIGQHYGIWRCKIERQSSNRLGSCGRRSAPPALTVPPRKASRTSHGPWRHSSGHMTFWSRTLFEPKGRPNVGFPAVMKVLTRPVGFARLLDRHVSMDGSGRCACRESHDHGPLRTLTERRKGQ